jgi:N-acetylglucosamine-6-phosphate deacetylase
VCHATHFYDVFPTPPVTEPGVRPSGAVEAILADSRVTVDFILDGEHVDPYVIKMAIACKGLDHVCLITDANKGAGLPPGRYHTIGYEVEFRYPGAPARGTENAPYPGSLAGSGLTMDQGLRNSVNRLDVDLVQAVRMVSSNPTNVLKLKTKGIIKEGYDADLVLLDKTLNVLSTWIGGKNYFTRK